MNKKERDEKWNRMVVLVKRIQQGLITQNAYIKELLKLTMDLFNDSTEPKK